MFERYDESKESFSDCLMKALAYPTSVDSCEYELISSMIFLCKNTKINGQKFGCGLLSISAAEIIFIVNCRKVSFNPCRKIASRVDMNEFVISEIPRSSRKKNRLKFYQMTHHSCKFLLSSFCLNSN